MQAPAGRGDDLWDEFCEIRKNMRQRFITMQRLIAQAQDSAGKEASLAGNASELEMQIRDLKKQIMDQKSNPTMNSDVVMRSLEQLIHAQSLLIGQLQRGKSNASAGGKPKSEYAGNIQTQQQQQQQSFHPKREFGGDVVGHANVVAAAATAQPSVSKNEEATTIDSLGSLGFDGRSYVPMGFPQLHPSQFSEESSGKYPSQNLQSSFASSAPALVSTPVFDSGAKRDNAAPRDPRLTSYGANDEEEAHKGGYTTTDFVSRDAVQPIPQEEQHHDGEDEDGEYQSAFARQLRQKKKEQEEMKNRRLLLQNTCVWCKEQLGENSVDVDMFGKEKVHRHCYTAYQQEHQ